ncbi:MAG: Spy/CpxP family protein refolding chaperone [Bacteroidales bacterium]|nr:Spy/CpxP family protein refolding chaperone [Bacteroidales bacterium]
MNNLVKSAMLILAMLTSLDISAQRNQGFAGNYNQAFYRCNSIPNLTAEQQTKITDLRTAHLKKMQDYRNQLAEKSVRLQTLRTAENADMKEINRIIDEIGVLRTEMMKRREQHFQNVRSLLTNEQKVFFDSFKSRGRGMGYGMGYGRFRNGMGMGYCRGRAW